MNGDQEKKSVEYPQSIANETFYDGKTILTRPLLGEDRADQSTSTKLSKKERRGKSERLLKLIRAEIGNRWTHW